MSINKVIILGRVGKQPDIKYMANGNAVTSFSVATSEKWNDKSTGERKEETTWFNITAFAKLGEIVAQYVNKGDQIYIEGKLKIEEYQTKDGANKTSVKVIADKVDFIGGQASGGSEAKRASKPDLTPSSEPVFTDFDDGDQIPF